MICYVQSVTFARHILFGASITDTIIVATRTGKNPHGPKKKRVLVLSLVGSRNGCIERSPNDPARTNSKELAGDVA